MPCNLCELKIASIKKQKKNLQKKKEGFLLITCSIIAFAGNFTNKQRAHTSVFTPYKIIGHSVFFL